MSTQQSTSDQATLCVKNVGGIDESTVTFSPGVTVLAGRNATNRTSLLRGLMAALGSDNVSIKGDTDRAEVKLTIGDDIHTRTLERNNDLITTGGAPYLDDAGIADLFAFLLESNDARRAVAQDADLREFIMRPVDTEEIQAEANRLVEERKDLEDELEQIQSLKGRLPGLEEKRTKLQNKIAEKREELAAKEAELEAADTDIEQTREDKQAVEEKLTELRNRRSDLEDVRYDIETERETFDSLRTEKSELEATQAELPDTPTGEIDEFESQIERLRTRKQAIEPQINELQSIISFNEELLNTDDHEVFDALETDDQSVTDQLVGNQEVSCWTCGTVVETSQIETTIGGLRELSQEKLSEVNDIDRELDGLVDQRQTLEEQQRERDRVEHQLSQIDGEIDASKATIERLQERRGELSDEIAAIETEVEAFEEDSYSEILDLHKEANQMEYDIGKLESDLERVVDEISEIEEQINGLANLKEERAAIQDEIAELRTRIDRIETQAVEAFNEHMDTVLELLDYANLDRIWLERVEQETREGRRKVTKNAFHLHVVRSTASGTTYEDTINHLSESEREVTGLVFALAGYLAHDVANTVPFMLLDSLEAIDSDRIATLISYLSDHTEYLVVALLPEDADALTTDHKKISFT